MLQPITIDWGKYKDIEPETLALFRKTFEGEPPLSMYWRALRRHPKLTGSTSVEDD